MTPKLLLPQWILRPFICKPLITSLPKKPRAAAPHLPALLLRVYSCLNKISLYFLNLPASSPNSFATRTLNSPGPNAALTHNSAGGLKITLCIHSPHIWYDPIFYLMPWAARFRREQLWWVFWFSVFFLISDSVSFEGPVYSVVLRVFSQGMFSLMSASSFSIKFQLSSLSNKSHV